METPGVRAAENSTRVLVSSVPVAGRHSTSKLLQAWSLWIILTSLPHFSRPSHESAASAKRRKAKNLISLAHNTFDQAIVAKIMAKLTPVLAGSAALTATRHEIETVMRGEQQLCYAYNQLPLPTPVKI